MHLENSLSGTMHLFGIDQDLWMMLPGLAGGDTSYTAGAVRPRHLLGGLGDGP